MTEVDFHPEYAGMIAKAILHDLADVVEKIEVVGGLRRKDPRVLGVSIIYISKFEPEIIKHDDQGDLFGGYKRETRTGNKIYLFDKNLSKLDYLEPRPNEDGETVLSKNPFHRKAMICYPKSTNDPGIPVDLIPVKSELDWGVVLTLRTGPSRYSRRMETAAKREGYYCDGQKLIKYSDRSWMPVPTEEEFFRLCKVNFIPPEQRGKR
jgi:DNA polymerase/3'-5' exonuclease PolX